MVLYGIPKRRGRFPWGKSDEQLEKKVDELAEKAKENDTSVQIELKVEELCGKARENGAPEEIIDAIARAVRAGVSEDMIPLSMEDMKRLMK